MKYSNRYTISAGNSRSNKSVDLIITDYAFKGIRYLVGNDPITMSPRAALILIELLQEHVAWTRHPLYQWGQKKVGHE